MNAKRLFFSALLPLGLASLGMAQTQTVRMTTEKPVGSAVALALNRTGGVTLDWGDGKPVTYEAGDDQVMVIEGTTKGKNLVLSVDGKLEMLTCADAGLTALDVTSATLLRSLYCQNNNLTSLDLSAHKKLTDLNCSGNQLTTEQTTDITAKNFPVMESLNLSRNKFTGYFRLTLSSLQHLNASHNEYTNMIVSGDNLDVLNCSNNNFTGKPFYLTSVEGISALLCENCGIADISLPAKGLPALKHLRADNNNLEGLDLSLCPELEDLSCRSNSLKSFTLPEKKLNSLDCSYNKLLFRHLPVSSKKPSHIAYAPQDIVIVTEDMEISNGDPYIEFAPSWEERENSKYVLDLSAYRYDAGGKRTTVDFAWHSVDYSTNPPVETKLTKATSTNTEQDYYMSAGKVSFLKGFNIVYAKMTSSVYPDLIIETNKFAVGKEFATDITEVTANGGGLNISIVNGTLTMSSCTTIPARICSLDGKIVWQGIVDGNTVSVRLPHGVYIVNGKKVLL